MKSPNGRAQLGDLVVDGRVILKRILKKEDGRILVGFICLSIGTNAGLLFTR
jgi:hypothetical protein